MNGRHDRRHAKRQAAMAGVGMVGGGQAGWRGGHGGGQWPAKNGGMAIAPAKNQSGMAMASMADGGSSMAKMGSGGAAATA